MRPSEGAIKVANPMTRSMELLARIEWMIDRVAKGNQRQFARMCGFKNESMVGAVLSRLRTDARYPSVIEEKTYAALAKGGGVSYDWLVHGEGSPVENMPVVSPGTPEMLKQVLLSKGARWSPLTINSVQAMAAKIGKDQTASVWTELLDRTEQFTANIRLEMEK